MQLDKDAKLLNRQKSPDRQADIMHILYKNQKRKDFELTLLYSTQLCYVYILVNIPPHYHKPGQSPIHSGLKLEKKLQFCEAALFASKLKSTFSEIILKGVALSCFLLHYFFSIFKSLFYDPCLEDLIRSNPSFVSLNTISKWFKL